MDDRTADSEMMGDIQEDTCNKVMDEFKKRIKAFFWDLRNYSKENIEICGEKHFGKEMMDFRTVEDDECEKCGMFIEVCECEDNPLRTNKELTLDLDSLYTEGYFYTKFDIGGGGHSITIKTENKEQFLDVFAKEWRSKTEKMLVEEEE